MADKMKVADKMKATDKMADKMKVADRMKATKKQKLSKEAIDLVKQFGHFVSIYCISAYFVCSAYLVGGSAYFVNSVFFLFIVKARS
jgi:hypothetical protein